MNTKHHNLNELRELINVLIDQTISVAQADRLNELLAQNTTHLDFYIHSMWMNEGLAGHMGGRTSRIDATTMATPDLAEASWAGQLENENNRLAPMSQANIGLRQIKTGRGHIRKRVLAWAIAAAIGALILGGIYQANRSDILNHSNRDKIAHHEPGAPLNEAGTSTAKRLETQTLSDGTTLIARAGTKFTIKKPRHLKLETGDLYLIVAKSKLPFIVETADGTVRATGTRFTVSTNQDPTDKKTIAAVAQGNVTLETTRGNVQLGAGQAGTFAKGQRPTRAPAPRLSYLVNWAKDAMQQAEPLVNPTKAKQGLIAVDPYGQNARLSLRKYHIDVYIENGIARTTVDQTFFNHDQRISEGTFYFPLPPNASVSRLATYVDGKLNEAEMVTRERGQEIYAQTQHERGVQTLLMETVESNQFKMRIAPIKGREEKRVFLSYIQNLNELYGTTRYWFPMEHSQELANELTIRVRIKNGAAQFDPQSSTHAMNVSIENNDLVLEYSAKKIKPDQDFLLNLLPLRNTASADTTDKFSPTPKPRVAVYQERDQHYLFAQFAPELNGEFSPEPRQWIVVNDISASRSKLEAETQRYIFQRLLSEADDQDSIFLIDLNTKANLVSTRPVNVRSDEAAQLGKHRAKRLIGATNIEAGLKAVSKIIHQHKLKNPHLLYLGDGVASDGEQRVTELPLKIPDKATFVGVGVGKNIDSLFLQEAANQTGGMFTMIQPDENINWRVFDLLAALNTPRMTKIEINLLDSNNRPMETIAYLSSRYVAAGEKLTMVALCNDTRSTQLEFRGQVGTQQISQTLSLKDAKQHSKYIPRLWAQRHIKELLKSDMSSKEEIIKFSQDFHIITPYTSLIVLEDEAMHEEYNVDQTRKDHWAQYRAPQTIEVVQEPMDWAQWGNHGHLAQEAMQDKEDLQLKSVQEIIDTIQLRIDVPFYYWPEQQEGSRHQLYRLCNRSREEDIDPTQLLTLSFLHASNQQDAIANWRDGVASSQAGLNSKTPIPSLNLPSLFLDMSTPPLGLRFQLANKLRQLPSEDKNRSILFGETHSPPSMSRASFRNPIPPAGKMFPIGLLANMGIPVLAPHQLPSEELAQSFQKAFNRRWARVEYDIDHFNFKRGYGDVLPSDLSFRKHSIASRPFEEGWNDGDIFRFDPSGKLIFGSRRTHGTFFGDQRIGRSSRQTIFPCIDFVWERAEKIQRHHLHAFMGSLETDASQPPLAFSSPSRPFLATSESPLQSQPGTASVLAADYLQKRKIELREKLTNHPQDQESAAEAQAIEAAIARIDRAAVAIEESSQFWGYHGNYQPRPQSIQPPFSQVSGQYHITYDLTRYASGLYSNSLDMLEEVARHHGTAQPRGTMPDDVRELVDTARSRFKPIAISYNGDDSKLLIGPNDQFAMTQQNEMYLKERFICDGNHILQYYDELGIAARRDASEMRLPTLRQLVPHLLEPADSLLQQFDVALVNRNDQQFTLKLSPPIELTKNTEHKPTTQKLDSHLLVDVDWQGRVLTKQLVTAGKTLLRLTFTYDENSVTLRWFDEKSNELNRLTYTVQPFVPTDATFAIELDQHIIFDMPLKKPTVYWEQLKSLVEKSSGGDPDEKSALTISRIKQSLPMEAYHEAIGLLRHKVLAELQENTTFRGKDTNAMIQEMLNQSIEMRAELKQGLQLGELVLYGSTGVTKGPMMERFFAKLAASPVAKYFANREAWYRENAEELSHVANEEYGLVGHLAAYLVAAFPGQTKPIQENFGNSPFKLALVDNMNGFAGMLDLLKEEKWAEIAVHKAAAQASTDNQKKKPFADAYWVWCDQLAKEGKTPVLTTQIATILRQVDQQNFSEFLKQQFVDIKEAGRTPDLLTFAEMASAWEEKELADEAYQLASAQLELNGPEPETNLLNRFAFGYALWAGNRYDQALAEFDRVMVKLEQMKIPVSPSFLAAMARLAAQCGKHERAIHFEEQSLVAERPHFPEMIDLLAFRQRYQWLWNQYRLAIGSVAVDDPQRESKFDSLFQQAATTWDRWREIDRDNTQLPIIMATLLTNLGREEESWQYLSSIIEQHPRNADSYYHVGKWLDKHGRLEEASHWYGEAPRWDTANPRWLFQHAESLRRLGKKQEAHAIYETIDDGQWAPNLQSWVQKARAKMR